MSDKKVVILGAGLTGLSCTYFLKKRYPERRITVLESQGRVGGFLQSIKKEGFLCELGPHSLRASGGMDTLLLIEELGLTSEIVFAAPTSKKRFIYADKKLQEIPLNPLKMLFSPLFLQALWRDLRAPPCKAHEESVYDFASRRFGEKVARRYFDPLVAGIFAGDITQLSISSLFPTLVEWEKKYGGVIKGYLATKSEGKQKEPIKGIYSFTNGLEVLPKKLAEVLKSNVVLNAKATALIPTPRGIDVVLADGRVFPADQVISTLPSYTLYSLIPFPSLREISYASVGVVHLGYRKKVLGKEGFGYLIPSEEKEDVLGVIWDSSVFPQQNAPNETRVTVMMGGVRNDNMASRSPETLIETAIEAVYRHMGLKIEPAMTHLSFAKSAIPQYTLGHQERIARLKGELKEHYPPLHLLGTAFSGISLNDCITNAKMLANTLNL